MNAVDVDYDVTGSDSGDVIVLAGSLGSTRAMWEPLLDPLGARLRVVRFDLRGHGSSPVPPGPYSIADLGADLVRLLDTIGVARAHLCGLSLGGMAAMWTAAHQPERVDRLVVMCSSVCLPPPSAWRTRAMLVRSGGMSAVADTVVSRWVTPRFAADNQHTVSQLRSMLSATPPTGYAASCDAIAEMDLAPLLGRITAPTLAIAAADDPATPPPHLERIAAGVQHGRCVTLEGGAHLLTVEQPRRLGELILEHLTGARQL
jgi:3-oxoadipate enol-lactonase